MKTNTETGKETPKKKQKVSISYTLKSFKGNNSKLKDGKVITSDEYIILEDIRIKSTMKFIEKQYGI